MKINSVGVFAYKLRQRDGSTIMNYVIKIFLFVSLSFLVGCDGGLTTGNRSGTTQDDYIEEPLSKLSAKYENALLASNKVLEMLKNREYEEINRTYVHESLRDTLTASTFESIQNQLSNAIGPIETFKPMQWGFLTSEDAGKDILFSFKVVEHEKAILNYAFVFDNDGQYNKLIGFHVTQRNGPRSPGSTK